MIIDISHHQVQSKINYDKLAKQVKLAIIRTQYGSKLIDRNYKTHHKEFQKRGVPTACYAWVRGISENDMRVEAADFYDRTKDLKPTFWFLDVEEKSMEDMRAGISAYVDELRRLGAKKIGIYIAHHLYREFNLNLSEVDAIWIPHYGRNNGKVDSKPHFYCDIHQFTSVGRLDGYSGNLDLNRIISDKPLSFFTDAVENKEEIPRGDELANIKISLHGKEIEVEGIIRDLEGKGNRTQFIPIKFLQKLGLDVGWDNKTKTVLVDYKEVK